MPSAGWPWWRRWPAWCCTCERAAGDATPGTRWRSGWACAGGATCGRWSSSWAPSSLRRSWWALCWPAWRRGWCSGSSSSCRPCRRRPGCTCRGSWSAPWPWGPLRRRSPGGGWSSARWTGSAWWRCSGVRRDRRARIERRVERRAVGLTAGLLLLAACTGGGHPAPEPSPTAPALTPKGSLLVDVGREFPSLALLPLGTLGAPQPVDLTGSLLGRFDFPGDAQLLADGTAYLLVTKVDGSLGFRTRELGSQIFELSRGHEPRKVGPPLGPVSPSLVGVAGGRVVIATCGGRHLPPQVMTLDLGTGDADGTWQPVVRACLAALSPDGSARRLHARGRGHEGHRGGRAAPQDGRAVRAEARRRR